jgi:hypothetical protein
MVLNQQPLGKSDRGFFQQFKHENTAQKCRFVMDAWFWVQLCN